MTDNTSNDDADRLQMLFPTVVQVSRVDGAAQLNQQLLPAIERIHREQPNSKPDSWCCDVYTTIGSGKQLFDYPEFKPIADIAREKILRYVEALKFDPRRFVPQIRESWFNVYSRTHSQEIHVHRNCVVSGIYYLKAPPGAAPTLLYSPMADNMFEPPVRERNFMNNPVATIDAVEGQMLLFRSSVRHGVLPSVIDEERITISFNATM